MGGDGDGDRYASVERVGAGSVGPDAGGADHGLAPGKQTRIGGLDPRAGAGAPGKQSLAQHQPDGAGLKQRAAAGIARARDLLARLAATNTANDAHDAHGSADTVAQLEGALDEAQHALVQAPDPATLGDLASTFFGVVHAAAAHLAAARKPAAPGAAAPATRGLDGPGQQLPHLARIQASFGAHDVSGVRAFVGGPAADATRRVGGAAFAHGNTVAFASAPDLHTAAHEAAHVVQQRAGVSLTGGIDGGAHDPHEQHADAVADGVVRGDSVEALLRAATTSRPSVAQPKVQRKITVNPTPTARLTKTQLIGDGTPANPGQTITDFNAYIARQADWFNEPTITAADRDTIWKLFALLKPQHMPVALGTLHVGELAALPPADATKLQKYAACFDASAQTIQLSKAVPTLARALQLGDAIVQLESFVPTPVLRVVIPEAGLVWLVDNAKIIDLRMYYAMFQPTLEAAAEWPAIQELLVDGVVQYVLLAGFIHDLHVFPKTARKTLAANVLDMSRARPVMLILFSANDWNTAFLQAANVAAAINNPKNLAIVVQGVASIAAAAGEVNRIADTYGQQDKTWNWNKWSWDASKGRLGQVVIAGHGSDQSVEMASPGTNPSAQNNNQYVNYDHQQIDSSNPQANGTETLIDTIISRMDPKSVNVVFAGCLVGSHEIPKNTDVTGSSADQQKKLAAALAAHPNLADYVRSRMAAMGATGQVQAANGSTTFSSFNVDPATGRAQLSNPTDPAIGGSKLDYLRKGIEPEGALRAALECIADAAVGPTKTTQEIRTRVAGLAGNTGWWETVTRLGFQVCLPAMGSDVDAGKLLDVVHRISGWFFGGWANMISVQNMANTVMPAEAPIVFPGMLASSWATADHLKVGVPEAWIQHDATKTAMFMTALDGSALKRETLKQILARGIVDPHLATLLPPGAPTKGQLLLALTIATTDHKAMPAPVRDFLRAAAGGNKTSAFPAALGVPPLIEPVGELSVLQDIELAPTSAPPPTAKTSATTITLDGNVDANNDKKNETYVSVEPHDAAVNADGVYIRNRPSPGGGVLKMVGKGTPLRVMGETPDAWSLIDFSGKTGFVQSKFLT